MLILLNVMKAVVCDEPQRRDQRTTIPSCWVFSRQRLHNNNPGPDGCHTDKEDLEEGRQIERKKKCRSVECVCVCKPMSLVLTLSFFLISPLQHTQMLLYGIVTVKIFEHDSVMFDRRRSLMLFSVCHFTEANLMLTTGLKSSVIVQ